MFGDCTSAAAFVLSGQPEGTWTFSVRATDNAGNFAQQARDFKIDGTAPETTIASGLADGAVTADTTLTWELAASENATFECRARPARPFAPCSGGASHVTARPRSRHLHVRGARDRPDRQRRRHPGPAHLHASRPRARRRRPVRPPSGRAAWTPTRRRSRSPSLQLHLRRAARPRSSDLVVKNIPAGATVTVNCPSGCAKKTYRKTKRKGGQLLLTPVTSKKLKVGTEITVIVSKPGFSSAVKVLTIRARKAPLVTTLCQPEGSSKPAAC